MNHKTLERWIHNYKAKNHLAKEYASIKKVSKQESVSRVFYDVDKTKNISSAVLAPSPVVQNSYSNIAEKIQFQSDVLNTYNDLSDVKYSERNIIILKKIRGL